MRKKVKIAHIITRLSIGGSSKATIDLCNGLSKYYENTLIYGGEKINGPIKTKNIHIPQLKRKPNLFNDFISFVRIFNVIRREKFDIVHTHTSKAGIIGRLSAKLAGRKTIIHTPHGHIFYGYFGKFKSNLYLFIERLFSLLTTKFVALTENEKKESIEFGVGSERKWAVIPSGVSIEEFKSPVKKLEIGFPKGSLVVGTVSRLEPVKGIVYLVLAAKIVIEEMENVNFLIIGDGGQRKMIEGLIQKFHLNGNFLITGFKEDVVPYISMMDVYVQPSLNEGMGRTLVEAQALGKPVVASKVCGILDVVLEGETGFLVDPANPQQLANAILKLLKDKLLREKMGRRAITWVNEKVDGFPKFSTERMLHLTHLLYEKLLQR